MGTALVKIHANRLAEYRKIYFDTNGDEYQGTTNGRLIFLRAGNRSNTTTTAATSGSTSGDTTITNTETVIVTDVIDDPNALLTINETLEGIAEDIDLLAMAMDKKNSAPLYVEDINGTIKKDAFNAIIDSDGIGPFIGRSSVSGNIIFQIETTGYNSFVVQPNQAPATLVTGYHSADGINWITAIGGVSNLASAAISTVTLTSSIIAIFACPSKYFRLVSSTTGQHSFTGYLKKEPLALNYNANGQVNQNIQGIGGSSVASPTAKIAGITAATTQVGMFVVGSPHAADSNSILSPIMVGGVSAPEVGARAGRVKHFLTDNDGRQIVASPNSLNSKNNQSLNVEDTTKLEGFNQIEVLREILIELKCLNLLIHELPLMLNSGQNFNNDYPQLRNNLTIN